VPIVGHCIHCCCASVVASLVAPAVISIIHLSLHVV
jgi:hypothetical protein